MSDTYLRCTVCGRKSTTSFASSMRSGWEKCCGYTMRLVRRGLCNVKGAKHDDR